MTQKQTENSLKILVVDDEPILPEVIRHSLRLSGHTVLTACDGAKALAVFKENRDIQAVVTDVNMPAMNGMELVHEVLFLDPRVKCILMTARPDQPEVLEFRQTGLAAGFLEKPFSLEALQKLVERVCMQEYVKYGV